MLQTTTGPESFTADERARLAPYFSNLDSHVFALTNLPETVKGALFARYSRSAKPLPIPVPSYTRRARRSGRTSRPAST